MRATGTNRNWKRLWRNKGARFGLLVIGISLLTALFAYQLAPDATPYANRMLLEIGGQKPGYRQSFIALKQQQALAPRSPLERFFGGSNEPFRLIPVQSAYQRGDSLIALQLIDEETTVEQSYPLTLLYKKAAEDTGLLRHKTFYLGTDKYGRDILSRLLIGVRVSLSVGLVTVLISLTLGVLLGSIAGYFRGRTDQLVMWFINSIWSIPTLLLVFAITLILGKGFWQVFIAIGLTMWVNVARMVRGQVLAAREREYVEAARALGYSSFRILFRHILPNIMGPVWVLAAANFASAIVIEAGLSFLGIGVQPPQPSWGLMIKENYNFIITQNPMLALAPGFAIMLLVLAFNLLGNGLRDALAVRE